MIGSNFTSHYQLNHTSYEVNLYVLSSGKLKSFEIKPQKIEIEFVNIFLNALIGESFSQDRELIGTIAKNEDEKNFLWHLSKDILINFNPILKKDGELICRCFGVTDLEIQACETQALLDVTNMTKAGGGCASCIDDIKELLGVLNLVEVEELEPEVMYPTEKREKINGKWPVDLIMEDIIPLLAQFNRENGETAKIETLVEKNLYLRELRNSSRLEELLLLKGLDLVLFTLN